MRRRYIGGMDEQPTLDGIPDGRVRAQGAGRKSQFSVEDIFRVMRAVQDGHRVADAAQSVGFKNANNLYAAVGAWAIRHCKCHESGK